MYENSPQENLRLERDISEFKAKAAQNGQKVFLATCPHLYQPKNNALACFTDDKEGMHATVAERYWYENQTEKPEEPSELPVFFPSDITKIRGLVKAGNDLTDRLRRVFRINRDSLFPDGDLL